MCYSAEARFVASGVLAGTSIAISRLPKEKNSLLLAAVLSFSLYFFLKESIEKNRSKLLHAITTQTPLPPGNPAPPG